jgi:hypothetical protein
MRKLVLKRETLRALSGKDLSQVQGALTGSAQTCGLACLPDLSRVKVSCMFIVCY